jgi:hypothetical protein
MAGNVCLGLNMLFVLIAEGIVIALFVRYELTANGCCVVTPTTA